MTKQPETNDEFQKLRDAFLEKEQIQGFLSTLEKLKADGSVNEQQYATMKSGYQQKMMAAVSEIARAKNELSAQLLADKQNLNHSKTELQELKAEYDAGELSFDEYRSSENAVDHRIESIRAEINYLQQLLEAKSPAQLAQPSATEHLERVAASKGISSQTKQVWETPKAISPVTTTATDEDLKSESKEELGMLHEPVERGRLMATEADSRSHPIERNEVEQPGKNWFHRHLNWTLVLCGYLGCLVPPLIIGSFFGLYEALADATLSEGTYDILGYFTSIPLLIVTVWHLKQKSRTMWHLLWLLWLPGYIVLPCLTNESKVRPKVEDSADF